MSLHNIPNGIDPRTLRLFLAKRIREPSGILYGNGLDQPPTAVEFEPDLSQDEAAKLASLVVIAGMAVQWGIEDLAVFRANRQMLSNYTANNSPTNAQTAAALKALIRVVETIIKE